MKVFVEKEIVRNDEIPLVKSLKKPHISSDYLLKNLSIKKLLEMINVEPISL
jgi:hypothetical protein